MFRILNGSHALSISGTTAFFSFQSIRVNSEAKVLEMRITRLTAEASEVRPRLLPKQSSLSIYKRLRSGLLVRSASMAGPSGNTGSTIMHFMSSSALVTLAITSKIEGFSASERKRQSMSSTRNLVFGELKKYSNTSRVGGLFRSVYSIQVVPC